MAGQSEADAAAGGAPKPSLSKRQRRKHVNPSNTWPQQPKIQSPAARVKANLRVAGLLSPSNSSASLDPALDLHSPEMRFGRFLVDPQQRKRHLAVDGLRAYLKDRCDIRNDDGGISELDLLKLWKGLWHTLYLADKVPVQEELSKRVAKLIWCVAGTEEEDEYAAQMYLDMCDEQDEDVVMEEVANTLDENSGDGDEDEDEDEEETSEEEVSSEEVDSEDSNDDNDEVQEGDSNDKLQEREDEEMDDELIQHCRGAHLAALFVKTFFQTMQREWGNMDKHRIDKFYALVRLVLYEIFEYMSARHWNRGIVLLFNDTIRDEVLFQVPNGLRYHLIDITVDELAKVNAKANMPLTEATFLDCLDPYFALAQNSDDSKVHERVMEHIFGKFLEEYSFVSEVEDDSLVFDQVHVGTIAKFLFELGSHVDTQERYRKPLYDMHKTYMKRIKQVGKDVAMGEESSCASLDVEEETAQDEEEGDNHEIMKEAETKANKRKRKAAKEDTQLSETPEMTSHGMENHDKADKKRKKSKREKESPPEPVVESPLVVEAEKEDLREPEKKKAKKKKKRKSSVGDDEGDMEKKEELITISCSEQKKAAEAATEAKANEKEPSPKKDKKKKKKSNRNETPDKTTKVTELTSEQKRVKFGRVNYSKSHAASMTALKTMEQPPLKPPGRGILRSKSPAGKGQSAAGSSKKTKSRKRAADYF